MHPVKSGLVQTPPPVPLPTTPAHPHPAFQPPCSGGGSGVSGPTAILPTQPVKSGGGGGTAAAGEEGARSGQRVGPDAAGTPVEVNLKGFAAKQTSPASAPASLPLPAPSGVTSVPSPQLAPTRLHAPAAAVPAPADAAPGAPAGAPSAQPAGAAPAVGWAVASAGPPVVAVPNVPAPAQEPTEYDMLDVLQQVLGKCDVKEALLARLEATFLEMPFSKQRSLHNAHVAEHEVAEAVERMLRHALGLSS